MFINLSNITKQTHVYLGQLINACKWIYCKQIHSILKAHSPPFSLMLNHLDVCVITKLIHSKDPPYPFKRSISFQHEILEVHYEMYYPVQFILSHFLLQRVYYYIKWFNIKRTREVSVNSFILRNKKIHVKRFDQKNMAIEA